MTAAQFEISIDGVPRTYRDQEDLASLAAQILKSRDPHSLVRLKDLESWAEIVIAFKAAQAPYASPDRPRCRDCQGSAGLHRLLRRMSGWPHLRDPWRSRPSALVLVDDHHRSHGALGPCGDFGRG